MKFDYQNTVYQLKRNIQFIPEALKFYTAKGELGESYFAVWLEKYGVGALAVTKVEINGSAKLVHSKSEVAFKQQCSLND